MGPEPLEPSRWAFEPEQWPKDGDCVALGADLEPATLVDAYRHGAFPMPHGRTIAWWSPMRRGILIPREVRVSRSLRRSAHRFTVTHDTDFAGVIDACAEPSRPGAWINRRIRDAYVRMHELGWAHAIETRDADGTLVGGLYGLQVGRLFAGESMFHHATDASKVALLALAELQEGGLIDVQWSTPHLAGLGIIEIARDDYLHRIASLVDEPGPVW